MIEDLNGADIAIEVEMVRTTFFGTVILIEGKYDCRFLDDFIDDSNCKLIPSHGKENAIKAIEILEEDNCEGIIAILDADFWHFEGFVPSSSKIFLTDYHDIEVMLVNSRAMDKVLSEYASQSKLNEFVQKSSSSSFREILFSRCLVLGLLRWISYKHELNLKFKEINYKKIVDKESLSIDASMLLKIILSNTTGCKLDYNEIYNNLTSLQKNTTYDHFQLCCGHDLTSLIAISFKKAIGSHTEGIANKENVESLLRLSYDLECLKNTKLYYLLKEWERNNKPFKIFLS